MARCILLAIVCLYLLSLSAPPASAIDIAGPLSLDDFRELRRDGQTPRQIVELAEQRRIRFALDATTDRDLRSLGFRKSMIARLKKIADDALEVPKPKPPKADDAPASEPVDPKAEAAHRAFVARVGRINAASGVALGMVVGNGVTLVADESTVAKYLPFVRQVEGVLSKTFPAPVGSGPDPRSTYLVLLRTESDYERWIKAMFAVHHREGIARMDLATLRLTLQAGGALPSGMSVLNLRRSGKWTRRTIAFNLGYLTLRGVTQGRAPASLLTGFGNVCEATMDGNPHIMLGAADYAERNIPTTSGNRWLLLLRQRRAAGVTVPVDQLFAYDYLSMKESECAEAWSLVQLLAADPARFSKWIAAVRDGKPAVAALRAIYEVDDKELNQRWNHLITGGR